ncbi:Crp/Fnr family transcriptional regulator [Novosphingobium sp. Rr 2-17]|nr:Crp/Fnr family transcriptional regulator [Novosphingobium sp. Rr 2-17]
MDAQSPRPDKIYELPMSQEQIGQATGLTAVHVNRMLKMLHAAGLIERSWRNVRFPSWEKLREIGDFSIDYLHSGQQVKLP